ncbi:unnamed protein product [Caenorhabditis auriculariae]|uniref:Uncharacterized protein n=1 Tax=Caenorhabditis auriculariae TaxID=2777116 RepID=A0A8S1HKU4_9PELO|nr:unnamed protein product [Caenorhabditis auriculariae]
MARTMDPTSTNCLFSAQLQQPFATPWTQEDAWHNVYSWINSQSNDSEGGDSVRSSTSSQPQNSPKSGGGYVYDDLEHPLLCDAPSSPFDPFDTSSRPSPLNFASAPAPAANNNSWLFNQNQNQNQGFATGSGFHRAPVQPAAPKPSTANSDYSLIHELVKLNLGNTPTAPSTPPAVASTSSPWSLPPDEPAYRPAPVGARREPLQPAQQYQNHGNLWRQNSQEYQQQQQQHQQQQQLANMQELFAQLVAQPELAYLMPQAKVAMARRNSNAVQLHARLEEVSEEYRQLEKERKQTEAELARHHLGKKISSSNGLPIPRLPTAPSRVDRLIVDFFREHARICTLLTKMEQLREQQLPVAVHQALEELMDAITVLQHHRNHERSAILQQLRGETVRYDEEKESAALIHSLQVVRRAATRARAANWCGLVWTLGAEDLAQQATYERLVASDFTIAPPPIRPRPVKK